MNTNDNTTEDTNEQDAATGADLAAPQVPADWEQGYIEWIDDRARAEREAEESAILDALFGEH